MKTSGRLVRHARLLLAIVGGEPFDAAPVRRHAATGGGIAAAWPSRFGKQANYNLDDEGGCGGVREMDSKSGKSWLLAGAEDLRGRHRVFAVGTNAKKVASRALRVIFSGRWESKMEFPR